MEVSVAITMALAVEQPSVLYLLFFEVEYEAEGNRIVPIADILHYRFVDYQITEASLSKFSPRAEFAFSSSKSKKKINLHSFIYVFVSALWIFLLSAYQGLFQVLNMNEPFRKPASGTSNDAYGRPCS